MTVSAATEISSDVRQVCKSLKLFKTVNVKFPLVQLKHLDVSDRDQILVEFVWCLYIYLCNGFSYHLKNCLYRLLLCIQSRTVVHHTGSSNL